MIESTENLFEKGNFKDTLSPLIKINNNEKHKQTQKKKFSMS